MWRIKILLVPVFRITVACWRWFGIAVAGSVLLGSPLARAELTVGDRFPTLAEIPFEGSAPATSGQVVLVDFWASWCAPCKDSFPAYARLHAEYAPRGVVILAVSIDQNATAYASFLRRYAPPFAVVRDKEQRLVRTIAVPAMPTCYLVDRAGRIRRVEQGFHGARTERELRAALDQLLAETSSAP